ncbi:maturation protein [ssRNA phage SRR7976300_8]|uniref:Maturation protein n=1 Tax=ssRNA phage SRR7976300_8 TaxID=2786657 RepID=A0A8S5L0F0_9VIRU|nr:maturation protein [ssRNA phage SRR7976300_8]DAD51105.1 TPA_asm: maturation protein [ssRNA phage SRR7976300_8]
MGVSSYSKTIGVPTGIFYKTIVGYKQDPVTTVVLPCDTSVSFGKSVENQYPVGTFMPPASGYVWQQNTYPVGIWPSRTTARVGPRALAYNKARSRFLDKIVKTRAQGMTGLAEREKTMTMVNKRLLQLLTAARALRNGDFRKFLQALNVKPLTKHRNKGWNRPREVAGLWLEYWFGWAPTIGDIYNLVEVYTGKVNPDYIKAGGGGSEAVTYTGGNSSYKTTTKENYRCSCHIGALVEVTNHDLLDLNAAGLLNPAQTALELIPFSWLAGWFMNLSQVLGSLTDTCGLEFKNGWISEKTDRECDHVEIKVSSGSKYGFRKYTTVAFQRSKFTELPPPTFEWKLPKELSVTRGATLAALIVQLFSPKGKK